MLKNIATPTSSSASIKANKTILFPLSNNDILKYKTLNSITNVSIKNNTEKYAVNLCI